MTAGTYNKSRNAHLAAAVLEIKERSSILNGAGAAGGRAPEQRLCRCLRLQAGEAQAMPPIGIGIRVSGSSRALAALFLPIPALVAATQAILS
eukprot:CAMPEP_0118819996 /NCGR_PEP_ID=MMETSP1162-20130426/7388_1 /TAXON_ID=33656 /ORGANISM="Phaeocystis Sp, Strain CCMP2710" /LENGTH=92 /DNA_ID=CAMNT_0006750343 /DNA_START=149 /DNA_END=428 /DNA_ORIENTATION=+